VGEGGPAPRSRLSRRRLGHAGPGEGEQILCTDSIPLTHSPSTALASRVVPRHVPKTYQPAGNARDRVRGNGSCAPTPLAHRARDCGLNADRSRSPSPPSPPPPSGGGWREAPGEGEQTPRNDLARLLTLASPAAPGEGAQTANPPRSPRSLLTTTRSSHGTTRTLRRLHTPSPATPPTTGVEGRVAAGVSDPGRNADLRYARAGRRLLAGSHSHGPAFQSGLRMPSEARLRPHAVPSPMDASLSLWALCPAPRYYRVLDGRRGGLEQEGPKLDLLTTNSRSRGLHAFSQTAPGTWGSPAANGSSRTPTPASSPRAGPSLPLRPRSGGSAANKVTG